MLSPLNYSCRHTGHMKTQIRYLLCSIIRRHWNNMEAQSKNKIIIWFYSLTSPCILLTKPLAAFEPEVSICGSEVWSPESFLELFSLVIKLCPQVPADWWYTGRHLQWRGEQRSPTANNIQQLKVSMSKITVLSTKWVGPHCSHAETGRQRFINNCRWIFKHRQVASTLQSVSISQQLTAWSVGNMLNGGWSASGFRQTILYVN